MTEAEWLACTDLYIMLAFLGDKVSDRKRWLTACACCRSIPGFLASDAGWNCLEVVERFADGAATVEELVALHEDGWDMRWYRHWPGSSLQRAITTYLDAHWIMLPAWRRREAWTEAVGRAKAKVTDLVRELFGIPFHPVTLAPSRLPWPDRCTTVGASRICRCWPTPSKKQAARTRTSSATAAREASMSGAAGW